jgi:hypothetical protein
MGRREKLNHRLHRFHRFEEVQGVEPAFCVRMNFRFNYDDDRRKNP